MDSPSPKRRRITASGSTAAVAASNDDDNNESPRRASYKAPTRASLAKHNPNILSGQANIATGDVQTEYATSSLRGPPRGLNPTALRPKMTAPRLPASPTQETSSSPSRRARTSHGSLTNRYTPNMSAPGKSVELNSADAEEDAAARAEERSLMEEENLADSVQRRSKRNRIGHIGLVSGKSKDQLEPELPPTAVHLGLEEQPRPPIGVLSSSPRGKTPGRKAILKSSPLKPRAVPQGATPNSDAQKSEAVDQHDTQMPQQAAKDTVEEEEDEETAANDPDILERMQKLNQLSKQLQALRSDVSFLQSQVRRHQEQPDQPILKGNLDRLVNVLITNSEPDRIESSPLKPTSLASRLSAFLPFAKRPIPVPENALLKEEILPSYKPIEGPNPLVHLQAFTTLSVSSSQRLTLIEGEGALLHQQQLTLSAPAPSNLDVDLVLFSDTDTDSVEQLSLQSITPWADAELGTWLRQQAEDTADIAVIGWGSSRYLDLARTRARCWAKCVNAFPQYTSPTSTPPSSRSPSAVAVAVGETEDLEDETIGPLLGKKSLRLQSPATKAALHISWHIDLDWIGDTESRISATVSVPPKWTERDRQRGSLAKIPETFEMLVTKVGVFEAVKVLVRLVLAAD